MSLDFKMIKANVKIVDVLARRGISLRWNGEWGSAVCPLPSHKPGDKDRTFQVNNRDNYWKCWSASCNEKAGKKGGDVINLVALLDGISEFAAAKKLAEAYGMAEAPNQRIQENPAPHIETREKEKAEPQPSHLRENSSSTVVVKGFMQQAGAWLDDLLGPLIPDANIRKDLRKCLLNKLFESFQNGKAMASH